jgi:hypothetical protein
MGTATHEHADLLLRLYEMRREPRMREAREWYFANFHVSSIQEMTQKFPQGGKENASVRMLTSYWNMACGIANRGLIDEDLFFENTGEQWIVWERLKSVIGAMREGFKNPHYLGSLEENVKRLDTWRDKHAPGSTEAMRQRMAAAPPQK